MFLRKQVRLSGNPISLRIFHSLCDPHNKILEHSQGNISRFFFNSFAFSMIYWILAIWSLVSLPFLNSACTTRSSWFIYCRSLDWRILSFTLLCKVKSLSCVQYFVTPWTVALQAPLSMRILQSRILEWVAVPSSRRSSQPRDLPNLEF